MNTSARIALLVLPLAFAGTVLAQAPARSGKGGPHHGHGPRPNAIIRALDTDKNHEVSAAEIANAAVTIAGLDTNSDGTVAADELRPVRPARPADAPERPAPPADAQRPARPVDPIMLALDANSDGNLTAAEIANAATSLAALDLNKDGKLTADEFRPLPPEGAAAPTGGRGPRGPRS